MSNNKLDTNSPKSFNVIDFMVGNHVAVNLLMVFILLAGFIFVNNSVKKEIFPASDSHIVRVSATLPQASPTEIEQSVILAIEEAVSGLSGVKKVESYAYFNYGTIDVSLLAGENDSEILQSVESAVKAVDLPKEVERPIVKLVKRNRSEALSFIVYGDLDAIALYDYAGQLRDKLLDNQGITYAAISDAREKEIAIKISMEKLHRFNLTLNDVANSIKSQSVDMSMGSIKTNVQEIFLKSQTRIKNIDEIKNIKIVSSDNRVIALSDIATITAGFAYDEFSYYKGKNAVKVSVFAVGKDNPIVIADIAKGFIDAQQTSLPKGLNLAVFKNNSTVFSERLNLMVKNAVIGILLVFLVIGLFLEPKLAFWVMLGIPISIVGSFIVFSLFDISINMITMFAFIVTLGVVVDDAVIVGEYIYKLREQGMSGTDAAIIGAKRMFQPVTFAIITNMVSFMPMFFLPGNWHVPFLQIPATVVAVLLISFVESIIILPAHLSYKDKPNKMLILMRKPQIYFNKILRTWIDDKLKPFATKALTHYYKTLMLGMVFIIISITLPIVTGLMKFNFFPSITSDSVFINVDLPSNSFIKDSDRIASHIMQAATEAEQTFNKDKPITRGIYVHIAKDNDISIYAQLSKFGNASVGSVDFANAWRNAIGFVEGVESISVNATFAPGGGGSSADINATVAVYDEAVAHDISAKMTGFLADIKGVRDIQDGFPSGKKEIYITTTDEAKYLGITEAQIATTIRNALYGIEVQKFYQGKDEIKLKVQLSDAERTDINLLNNLYISVAGKNIPLANLANISTKSSAPYITRISNKRIYTISANVDKGTITSSAIKDKMEQELFPQLRASYPSATISLGKADLDIKEVTSALKLYFFISFFIIYALLATLFRSYIQPLAIMLSIPFGIGGAFIGHMIVGTGFSLFSFIGVVALSGVVINTGLLLIDSMNENRNKGNISLLDSSVNAVISRFRPIVITSLTTFFGIMPLIFETSKQAQFLIPMAISLSFGVIFSAAITLFVMPSFELVLQDIKRIIAKYVG